MIPWIVIIDIVIAINTRNIIYNIIFKPISHIPTWLYGKRTTVCLRLYYLCLALTAAADDVPSLLNERSSSSSSCKLPEEMRMRARGVERTSLLIPGQ